MSTRNSRVGSDAALSDFMARTTDKIHQLQAIMPGSKGGGSVAAPFSIGSYTFEIGGQVDLELLAQISASTKTTYVPTTTGITLGTDGSTIGFFTIDYNLMVDFECITALGTSPTVSTGPTWTVPLIPDSLEYLHAIGNSIGYDATGTLQDLRTILLAGSKVEPRFTTTTPALGQVTATTPITWTTNDAFFIRGRYRARNAAA